MTSGTVVVMTSGAVSTGVDSGNLVGAIANRVLQALEQPFKLDRATVRISASIGIASRTSCTSRTLLHVADRAMYKAEGVGTGHIVTSPQYVVSSSWL